MTDASKDALHPSIRTVYDGLNRAEHFLESPESYSRSEKRFVFDSIGEAKAELRNLVPAVASTTAGTGTSPKDGPGFAAILFLDEQRRQHEHDMRNHQEIVTLHRTDRIKHYGLHFAKYVGRLARGASEPKTAKETVVDAFLVVLSSANALLQDLSKEEWPSRFVDDGKDPILSFADAAGRYADACEKIDHVERFIAQIREANRDIAAWIVRRIEADGIDIASAIAARRAQLAERQFYVVDGLG